MGRKSAHGLPPGIQFTRDGFYLATLEGKEAQEWRERYPGCSLPRRRKRSLDLAVKAQRALIADLKAGKDPYADNPTLSAYVEGWVEQRRVGDSTKRRYRQSWQWQIATQRIGRLRIRQVTKKHVDEWVRTLETLPRQDDPDRILDAYSVIHAFAVLRGALNTAVADGLIPTNPCKGVELPQPDDEEITPLSPAEVDVLLNLVDAYDLDKATGVYHPHRQAALYHIAIRLGLRQGELLGLRWKDVDLERRELRVAGQMRKGAHTPKGKTKKARRALPLTADLVRILHAHKANQAEERRLMGEGWNMAGLVFVTENGTPISASNLWRSYTALQRRAGLADPCEACEGKGRLGDRKQAPKCEACEGHGKIARFRFHDLRHTYAALSLAAGVELFTLSRRMGHSSISVTADRYGHLYQGQTADAEALDKLLKRA
jgi:integrase